MLSIPIKEAVMLHELLVLHRKMFNSNNSPSDLYEHNLDYNFWSEYIARMNNTTPECVKAIVSVSTWYRHFIGSCASFDRGTYPLSLLKADCKELLSRLREAFRLYRESDPYFMDRNYAVDV